MMLGVCGASGNFGRRVLFHIKNRGASARFAVLSRTPDAVRDVVPVNTVLRRVDFADPDTFRSAFVGVQRLLLISTGDLSSGLRASRQVAAIQAAVNAGVGHIVYTSFVGADPGALDPVARDHGQTEAGLAATGIRWTALRNNSYAEVLPFLFGLMIRENQISVPHGAGESSWVTREDCARVAASALLGDAVVDGPTDVTGPEALSLPEMANRIVKFSDGALSIRQVDDEAIQRLVMSSGMPEPVALRMTGMLLGVAKAGHGAVSSAVKVFTGSNPTPVDEVLRALANRPVAGH